MPTDSLLPLAVSVFAVAVFYSAIGHAGASGYIAVLSLFSLPPELVKPTALALNVLVAAIASWQFLRAQVVPWSAIWPYSLFAVPFAFVGGYVVLPARVFQVALGTVLLLSAAQWIVRRAPAPLRSGPPRAGALGIGAGVGLLSGLTGTGGGIFLTPILVFGRWADARTAAAFSAPFILFNSLAGLIGYWAAARRLPGPGLFLLAAAAAGGAAGSYLGSRRLPTAALERMLAAVLLVAGLKLILAG